MLQQHFGADNHSYGYSYDNDSELNGISGGPLPVTLGYDADGHRTSLAVGSGSTPVSTGYQYDSDSRATILSYTGGGNSLGSITYTYDNDSRVTSESGGLANLKLPSSEGSNTYYSTNQIKSWNGATPTPTPDPAGNLIKDPVTGATYAWDSRNELSSINTTSYTNAYDAIMRRYDQAAAYGDTTTYLHDNKDVSQSDNTANGVNNYLTMPGTGEVLAFTTASGTYVPLQDRLGSTIGLVNSSNSLQTQYTYDPFGNVTTSGTASSYPYLFGRMELDSSDLYRTQTRHYPTR